MNTLLLTLGLLATTVAVAADMPANEDVLFETGRRIYEDGLLPDGEALRAVRPEGFVMEGEHAACVTCHRRSGMGSLEGSIDNTILVPPVAGPVLFAPSRFATSYLDRSHHYVANEAWARVLTRPAYDRQSLAHALRTGLDPGGKAMLAPMPVYDLDDVSMTALAVYMERLLSEPGPGVDTDTLHLATVVTPDARPEHVDAVLGVLQAWCDTARGAGKPWRLHVWNLSGQPATWTAQLEANYQEQPVFALLSGAGRNEWLPVHRFCENLRMPCILPTVEVAPATADDDDYTMYFSPGVGLEARVLARHLDKQKATAGHTVNIVQVYGDSTGRHAADTLRDQLDNSGSVTVMQRRYRVTAPRAALKGIAPDDILVLWLRPGDIAQLVSLLPEGPAAGRVYISALLATPEALTLPPAWKKRVSFVSLFDDLGLQGEIARLRLQGWLEQASLADHPALRRVQADAYAASYLFNEALGEIRNQEVRRPAVPLSREHLLETLEVLVNKYNDSTGLVDPDSHVAYYGRMSLGPRQRVAVRGGTIMRYTSPESSRLVAVSKRIVP